MAKVGRNQPCPCGSGRKYKQCHGRPSAPAAGEEHAGAVSRCLDWLQERHRKAVQEFLDELIFGCFWPDEAPDQAELSDDLWQMVMINMHEWLLAHGDLRVKGRQVAASELLFGPGGPRLAPGQKGYLRQLASRPLRLYEVTDSRPGDGVTLVDALDQQADPLIVQERSGSQSLKPGDFLGARVVEVGNHLELSGALYPFTQLYAGVLIPSAQEFERAFEEKFPNQDQDLEMAFFIAEHWFRNLTLPPPMPQLTDASTGEPLLLVTDHYRILDRGALEAAMNASQELEREDDERWAWLEEDDQGVIRARLSLSFKGAGQGPERVELFCRTQRLADEGRAWFEALAGESVAYLTREITDPAGAMRADSRLASSDTPRGRSDPDPEIPPEAMTGLVAEAVRRHYANWADEPIPALGDHTPREAIATPAGLERVKGLLRSYEDGERSMAEEDGREPLSFQFLWDELGIARD